MENFLDLHNIPCVVVYFDTICISKKHKFSVDAIVNMVFYGSDLSNLLHYTKVMKGIPINRLNMRNKDNINWLLDNQEKLDDLYKENIIRLCTSLVS